MILTVLRVGSVVACLVLLGALPAAARAAGDPLRARQWYLDTVHADAAHRVSDGRGVTVAVLDTGVDASHEDLNGVVETGPDFVGTQGSGRDPDGHGTGVAGIIAAVPGNGLGIAGAAPGARVLSIRVLGQGLSGTAADVAAGVDAAIESGAGVINLSLGVNPDLVATILPTSPIVAAINRATAKGVVVVAAAGNYALPLCAQPIAAQGIICVGAVDRAEQRASYSDYGVRVDVMAPGGDNADPIVTTFPNNAYADYTGTSEATPLVSAQAALLLALGMPGVDVRGRIIATARALPDGNPPLVDFAASVAGATPLAGLGAAAVSRVRITAQIPSAIALTRLRAGRVGVRVGLDGPGTCRARLVAPGGRTLARGALTLPAAGKGTLRLTATAAGRSVRRGAGALRVRLALTAAGGARLTRTTLLRR